MISRGLQDLLSRRPVLEYDSPRSGETIPEVKSTVEKSTKEQRVSTILKSLDEIVELSSTVEAIIHERAKNQILKLNISNPEDAVVAQAVARQFPELAKTEGGFTYADEITFEMFNKCVQKMKAAGKANGLKQQPKAANFNPAQASFGGRGLDARPSINQATIPFAPINLPAFIAAGIPILFGMLFPLINATVKANIVGHTHPTVAYSGSPLPLPVPSGPGLPVIP